MVDQAKEPSTEKLFFDLFYEAFDLVHAQRIDLERRLAELKTKLAQTTDPTEKLEIECEILQIIVIILCYRLAFVNFD